MAQNDRDQPDLFLYDQLQIRAGATKNDRLVADRFERTRRRPAERGPGLRRNQLGGQIGTDPIFTPTSHTGRPAPDATAGLCRPRLTLTAKERALYDGEFGPVLQKTIRAVVDYGEIFGASRLIPLKAAPHHAVSWGSRGIEPLIRLYRELADAGLRTYAPFTANPKPLDTIRLPMASDQLTAAEGVFSFMEELEQLNFELGMCSPQYWSCTCYEPEMGNAPEPGDYLAWSESSAVKRKLCHMAR